jgi:hypothetical protein
MHTMRKLICGLVAMTSLAVASPALAAVGTPALSGTATATSGGIQLTSNFSDASTTNDFGAVTVPVTGVTLAQLTSLSAQYTITHGSCGGGSPRFQIAIGGKNVFVYVGPAPSFTGCGSASTSTGNVVGTSDQCRVDTSQFAGGTQCSTWAAAVALLGSQTIQSIVFAVDGGWSQADKIQTVLLQGLTINGTNVLGGTGGGGTGGTGGKIAPGQFCKALRTKMGRAAFNELWSTSGTSNGMGKCASTIAHARNAGKTEDQILAALTQCVAQGKKGADLGACVAATDGVTATLTEAQESAKAKKNADKGKNGNNGNNGKGKAKAKKTSRRAPGAAARGAVRAPSHFRETPDVAVVGLLHPGEMGSAVGAALRAGGHTVLWASEKRSNETRRRAEPFDDAGTPLELARSAEIVLSICPPHAARGVAESVGEPDGIFVDANAIAPATSRAVGSRFARYVDGGIIGPPPRDGRATHLYLAGDEAETVAALFEGTDVVARAFSHRVGDASALKMAYAAWSKGSAALLLAIRAVARAEGVEEALLGEWDDELERWERARASAETKGWRWVGEMEEIAATFAAAGAPDGFHRAAAAVYRDGIS